MRPTFLVVLALLAATAAARPAWSASTRSGTITYEIDLSGQAAGEEVRLWVPYPVSDEHQTISDVRVSGTFSESAVYADKVYRTPMLFARWAPGAAARTLTYSFAVSRNEVLRRDLPGGEAPWDPKDYALYLAPTSLGPTDGPVRALAEKIVAGKTGVLEKAKAIYDWTCENTFRNPDTRGCGEGDVCRLLENPGGKCADIHSVFVALARAAGVPSREVFGIRQGKQAEEDITTWQHCWAEFYLPGYGWVPADPADVRKAMLTEKLHLLDRRTDELRAYFWGGIDAHRVKLGEGRDLTLGPPQAGKPVNYLMYPFAQVGATTVDWLDPKTFRYAIRYREL